MLHLIPAPLHRAGYRLAHALRKRWWRIRKPRLVGCRVLAFDAEGRVLLVRHSYGTGKWMPPGGGIGRGETPVAAAVRELREETGCSLHEASQIALVEEGLHGTGNLVHVIAGRGEGRLAPDGREVIEAAFFAMDDLPDFMPLRLRSSLPEWVKAAKADRPADPDRPPVPLPALPPEPTA